MKHEVLGDITINKALQINNMTVPSEKHEGQMLANWLRAYSYEFTHIANESGGFRNKWEAAKAQAQKKLQWMSKGFPDYCIVLKRWSLLFVELKRQRPIWKSGDYIKSPSKITPEQERWIDVLNCINNVAAHFCFWAQDAIDLIGDLEKIQ